MIIVDGSGTGEASLSLLNRFMTLLKKKITMKYPQIQERPGSTRSFETCPAKMAPMAIPTAVERKRYPPPTSLKPSDSMAKGMILSWVNAPIKRKNEEP